MQIRSILPGYSDPTTAGHANEPAEIKTSDPQVSQDSQSSLSVSSALAAGSVLARYDITDITPQELSSMLQELHGVGALSDAELQDLLQIVGDLDAQGIDSDESVDLLDFYSDQLQELEHELADKDMSKRETMALASLRSAVGQRLHWLDKIAMVQADSDLSGIDTIA